MAKKRFIDCEIWNEDWFAEMPANSKLFWIYLITSCDHAGIWKNRLNIFTKLNQINLDCNEFLVAINKDKNRIDLLPNGNWFIKDFIAFQYGKLTESSTVHKSIIKILKENGIDHIELMATNKDIAENQFRMSIYYAYEKKCLYCQKQLYINNFVIDHLIPISKNGTDDFANLALSCIECNYKKFNKSLKKFCKDESLDFERISLTIKRVLKGFQRGIDNSFNTIKDKAKDQYQDKDN